MLRSGRDRKARSKASGRGEGRRHSAASHAGSGRRDSSERTRGRNGGGRRTAASEGFVLYVEGARDRELLEAWARRAEPAVARCIEEHAVILGGRQPARALADFRKRGGSAAGWRGLVVLDRDHHPGESPEGDAATPDLEAEPGLDLFVWGLRHIESYLLVPSAIRRMIGAAADDDRVDRVLSAAIASTGSAAEPLHAKRLLGAGGSLAAALGRDLPAGEIARAMRPDELHDDVRRLLARIASLSGVVSKGPEVVIRRR